MANSKRRKNEELEALKKNLGEEVAKLRADLREAESRMSAVNLTLQMLYGKVSGRTNKNLREFKGLTQVEALLKIAQESGTNHFKLREAKKVLLDAGLVKSKKNAGTILFTAIQRSGRFKRVAPGEYEVITKPISVSAGFTTDAVLKRASA